jgi:NTP pyrophosphatase (non-canonical NTP hydrolase)
MSKYESGLYGQCPHCGGSLRQGHECSGLTKAASQNPVVTGPLTFAAFRNINTQRKLRWHAGATRTWVGPDWGNELAGETGELCNLIKKEQRHRDGILTPGDHAERALAICKEIGDVVICAELIAEFYGVSLEDCVKYAFNRTSEKMNFPERL